MKKYLTSMIIISTGFMVACGQGKFKSNTEIQSQQSKASQAEMGKAKKMQEEASKRIEEATKKVNEANEALKRAKAESDKAKGVENYEEKMKSLDQRLAEIAKAEQASVDAKKELDQARVELEKIKDQTPEERALEEERIEQQRKAIADLVKHNEEFMKSLDSMQAQITKETAEVGEYSLERLKAYEEAPANVLLVLHGHISKDYLDGFRNEFLEKVKDNVHGNRFFDNDGSGIYSGFKRVRDRYLVSATYTQLKELRTFISTQSSGGLQLALLPLKRVERIAVLGFFDASGNALLSPAFSEKVNFKDEELLTEGLIESIFNLDELNCDQMETECIKLVLNRFKPESNEGKVNSKRMKSWETLVEKVKENKEKIKSIKLVRGLVTPLDFTSYEPIVESARINVGKLSAGQVEQGQYSLLMDSKILLLLPTEVKKLEENNQDSVKSLIENLLETAVVEEVQGEGVSTPAVEGQPTESDKPAQDSGVAQETDVA